jgi:GT2 family glycosyltransferase
MCFRKQTWKELGGFKSGIIGCDTAWSNKVRRSGKKIYLVNQLYYFHYYRFNTHINDKSHIT